MLTHVHRHMVSFALWAIIETSRVRWKEKWGECQTGMPSTTASPAPMRSSVLFLYSWASGKMRKSEAGLADADGFSVTRGILLEESRVLAYGFVLSDTLIDLLMSPEVSHFCL